MQIKSIVAPQHDHFVLKYESFSLYVSDGGEWHHVGRTTDVVTLPKRPAFFALKDTGTLAPVMDDMSTVDIGEVGIDLSEEFGAPENDGIVRQGRTTSRTVILRAANPTGLARDYLTYASDCGNCAPKTSEINYVHKFGPTDEYLAKHDYQSCTRAAHEDSAEERRRRMYDTAIDNAYGLMVKEGDIPE